MSMKPSLYNGFLSFVPFGLTRKRGILFLFTQYCIALGRVHILQRPSNFFKARSVERELRLLLALSSSGCSDCENGLFRLCLASGFLGGVQCTCKDWKDSVLLLSGILYINVHM